MSYKQKQAVVGDKLLTLLLCLLAKTITNFRVTNISLYSAINQQIRESREGGIYPSHPPWWMPYRAQNTWYIELEWSYLLIVLAEETAVIIDSLRVTLVWAVVCVTVQAQIETSGQVITFGAALRYYLCKQRKTRTCEKVISVCIMALQPIFTTNCFAFC